MTVSLEQLQAIVQAQTTMPSGNWFATLDAAQLNHDTGIDWSDYAAKHEWKNLLGGTAEGEEADLTCWLAPLTDDILQLTAELTKTRPFSCTWLQSTWLVDDIAAFWQDTSNVRLPNGQYGLLRFYDPCVLRPLQNVLTPIQRRTLNSPVTQWLYIDREGLLANLASPHKTLRKHGQLTLNNKQLKQLQEAGEADGIILQMQVNDHLPVTHDPFATYRQINIALDLLKKHHITDVQEHYLFSVLTLDWPLEHFDSEALNQALAGFQQKTTDLTQIIELHSPRLSQATKGPSTQSTMDHAP